MANCLILSFDLEEWYYSRWATGFFSFSRWKSIEDFFRDYYKSEKPVGEIIKPTQRILDLLRKEGVRTTFFVLGEMAEWYPDLVKEIAEAGHEIACHGMHHLELTSYSAQEFSKELIQARQILEKLAGRSVIGFRAPKLIFTDWLPKVLIENGFLYDSSLCPSRKIFGKYKGQLSLPQNPYLINEKLIELPIPTFPFLKLPGAVSIMTRVFGWTWTRITLDNALRTGAACYYMHPYEFNKPPRLENMSFLERIFWRRSGVFMENILRKILNKYQGQIVSAEDYIKNYFPNILCKRPV